MRHACIARRKLLKQARLVDQSLTFSGTQDPWHASHTPPRVGNCELGGTGFQRGGFSAIPGGWRAGSSLRTNLSLQGNSYQKLTLVIATSGWRTFLLLQEHKTPHLIFPTAENILRANLVVRKCGSQRSGVSTLDIFGTPVTVTPNKKCQKL